jgi:hypothetical protein
MCRTRETSAEPSQEDQKSIMPNLAGIMGDVMERHVSTGIIETSHPNLSPSTGPTSTAAFPDAIHRHKSKASPSELQIVMLTECIL